jgi:uncharacterized protein YndB with AHSA1/START domain
MRLRETFSVARPPNVVFDYVVQPGNLADWQTSKTFVEQITDGPPRLGTRVRERTKVPGRKEWEQIVEVVEFERPRRFRAQIVEGPAPGDGCWTFERDGDQTRVHFEALVELRGPLKLLQPVVKLAMARSFATYHRNLRRNVEAL